MLPASSNRSLTSFKGLQSFPFCEGLSECCCILSSHSVQRSLSRNSLFPWFMHLPEFVDDVWFPRAAACSHCSQERNLYYLPWEGQIIFILIREQSLKYCHALFTYFSGLTGKFLTTDVLTQSLTEKSFCASSYHYKWIFCFLLSMSSFHLLFCENPLEVFVASQR